MATALAEIQVGLQTNEAGTDSPQQRLGHIERKYTDEGNIINYATTLLEGHIRGLGYEAESETIDNLSTHVIEQVLADANLPYHYTLSIEGDRFKTPFGYMDEMIEEGVANISDQAHDFEIPRFEQNARFLGKLKDYKNLAQQGREDLRAVEFSPAPERSKAADERGYNHDTLSVSYFNPETQQIEVTQYWFDCSRNEGGIQEYQDLLRAIGLNPDNTNTPLDIMGHSGMFSLEQIESIENFVVQHGGLLSDEHIREQSQAYMDSIIRPELAIKLINPLKQLLPDLLDEFWQPHMFKQSQITEQLANLAQEIRFMQFKYRIWMKDHFGIDTFDNKTSQQVGNIDVGELDSQGIKVISKLLDELGYQAAACGSKIGVNTSSAFNVKTSLAHDKGAVEFICHHCGHYHDISEGHVVKCESCGIPANC